MGAPFTNQNQLTHAMFHLTQQPQKNHSGCPLPTRLTARGALFVIILGFFVSVPEAFSQG